MSLETIHKLLKGEIEDRLIGWEYLLTLSEQDIISILPRTEYTSKIAKIESHYPAQFFILSTRIVIFDGNLWWHSFFPGDEMKHISWGLQKREYKNEGKNI